MLCNASKEIQERVEELEKTSSTSAEYEQKAIAEKAVQRINSNTELKSRVLSALQAGGTSALNSALDHPAASFVIDALKDWQKTKN